MPTEITTMSLAEFLRLPESEEDGTHYELDEGELIHLSPAGAPHGHRTTRIIRCLINHLPESDWDILPGETGFIMAVDPKPTVRGADIAVLPHRDAYAEGMLREPAALIVEVISPSNTAIDIERKRTQYLQFGVREVWVVYEKTKSLQVSIHPAERKAPELRLYQRNDAFDSVLGFPVELAEIFK